jgi:hypothetical protein
MSNSSSGKHKYLGCHLIKYIDARSSRFSAVFVPVENQGSNMYPTVLAFAILPSDLHAKSKPSRNVKSLHNARGLSAIHPQNHPLDSAKTRKKSNPDDPACVHQQRRPGAAWN